jgi:hypothetical protein
MTTRRRITEQSERLYMRSFDREDLRPKVDYREIALLVDQVAHEFLALETQQAAKLGVVDIPTCMIATYANQSVTTTPPYVVALPAFPLRLPLDMGVWSVANEPDGRAYIPIKTDFWDLLSAEDEGLLEDQVGFYVEGRKLIFTRQPSSSVKIKLLIVDPSLLSDFDPYPIPPEAEIKIIEKVVAILHSRGLATQKPKG